MNKIIYLNELKLKIFTEQNVLDYCQLNSINPDNIIQLDLNNNLLTDISGIKLFKNLETLYLFNNELTDISVLKYLTKLKKLNISYNRLTDISVLKNLNNLEILAIRNLKLKSDQIQYINSLKNLKELWYEKSFKNMSVLKQLNKNIIIML